MNTKINPNNNLVIMAGGVGSRFLANEYDRVPKAVH